MRSCAACSISSRPARRRSRPRGAAAPALTINHQLGAAQSFALDFKYADAKRSFRWSGSLADGHARFAADFGGGGTTLPASISLLSPEAALNEAMFF